VATFRQRDGRWQAIIRRVDLKATKTFDRKGDAQAWARAREREADMADTAPAKMLGTLAPLIDRYDKEVWPVRRWGLNKANELRTLKADLGARLLTDLKPGVLVAYATGLGLSPGGVSTRLSYLREVLKTANALWGTPVPMADVDGAIATAKRLGVAGKSGIRARRPIPEEIERVIAVADAREQAGIDLSVIIRILSVLPLRVGELLNIQWGDLSASRRTVLIRSRKHPDARVKETNHQEVPLIAFKGVDTFQIVADRPRYLDSPFPYKRPSVSVAFHQCALRAQVLDLHLHDLRAHSLSALLEAGIPIPQVALISGHRNWKILSRHYARIDPLSIHDALKRLD